MDYGQFCETAIILPCMADKKTWWERLPEPFASIKGNALWSAISVVIGALITGIFSSKIAEKSVLVAAYIAFAAIGVRS